MKDGIIFTILIIVWTVIKLLFKLLAVVVKILASLIIFFGLYVPLFYGVFGIVLLATTEFTFGGAGTDQVLYYIGFGLSGLAAVFISVRNLIVRPLSAVFAPRLEYRDEVKKEREKNKKTEGEQAPAQYGDPRGYDPYYGRGGYYPPYDPRRGGQQPYEGYAPYRPHAPYYEDPRPQGDPYAPSSYYGYGQEAPSQPYYPDDRAQNMSSDGYRDEGYLPAPERPLIYYSKRRPGVLVKEYSDRFELFEEVDGTRRYIGTEYKDE